jgi:hypothetical protein
MPSIHKSICVLAGEVKDFSSNQTIEANQRLTSFVPRVAEVMANHAGSAPE